MYKSCSCRYPDLKRYGLCAKCKKVHIEVTDAIKTVTQKVMDLQLLREYYDFTEYDYLCLEIEIELKLWGKLEEEGLPKLPWSRCANFYKERAELATDEVIYQVLRHMTEEEYALFKGRNPPVKFWIPKPI